MTAERQRVRAAQAGQIQRLSGKLLSGSGCMSLRTQCGDAIPSQMSPQGLLCRMLPVRQAN